MREEIFVCKYSGSEKSSATATSFWKSLRENVANIHLDVFVFRRETLKVEKMIKRANDKTARFHPGVRKER